MVLITLMVAASEKERNGHGAGLEVRYSRPFQDGCKLRQTHYFNRTTRSLCYNTYQTVWW
jgi:hypothetical protein